MCIKQHMPVDHTVPVLIKTMNSAKEKVIASNASVLTSHCLHCKHTHHVMIITHAHVIYMYMYIHVYTIHMESRAKISTLYRYKYQYTN